MKMMDMKEKLAKGVVSSLQRAGFEAYFAGGCVRDMIMRRRPLDFDIATSARPEEVMRLFKRTVPVGLKYGVVLVLQGKEGFEVAAFRSEGEYIDGRHPQEVHFVNAQEDAQRRDFTVNGLFYDPVKRRVLDFVRGRKDIKAKIIRCVGEPAKRFEEDKLRLLRAARFASALDFTLHRNTRAALKKFAPEIKTVSAERIGDELTKLFTRRGAGRGLLLLHRSGLLKEILPEVSAMRGVQQPRRFHPEGDVFRHTYLMMEGLRKPSAALAFAVLLHDIGKPATFRIKKRIRFDAHNRVGSSMARKICRRLRFSNNLTDDIVLCIDEHMRFMDVQKMRQAKLKRILQRRTFLDELELHRLDCIGSHGDLANWRFLRRKMKQFTKEDISPLPIIRGGDLMILGYKEGPVIGKILRAVEEEALEDRLHTKEETLEWVRENFKCIKE